MEENFAEYLKRVRVERGLTQAQIATALNVTRAAVGQWERGVTNPSFQNLQILHEVFDKDFELRKRLQSNVLDKFKNPDVSVARDFSDINFRFASPRLKKPYEPFSIPVNAFAAGPHGAIVDLGSERPVLEYIFRPDVLLGDSSAYAIGIYTDALSPRFERGESIYVTEAQNPTPGDYVVLWERHVDGIGFGSVLRFKAEIDNIIQVHLIDPEHSRALFRIDKNDISRFHRVIPWNELLTVRRPTG